MDEGKLIRQLQRGSAAALEAAIRQYTPYVSAAAYRVLGASIGREDLEEVVSDTFVSLWTHASELDTAKGTLRSWLGAVAANAAKNKLRAYVSTVPLDDEATTFCTPMDEIERADESDQLWRAVEAMGEPDTTLFFRYYYEGDKLKNIAQDLGMNLSTAKTRLARGRKALRTRLDVETGGTILE